MSDHRTNPPPTDDPNTESPLVRALLAAGPNLNRPADIWSVVLAAHAAADGKGWPPVLLSEATGILAEASLLIGDPLTAGQPPNWQWNLRADLELLQRIGDGDRVSLTQGLDVMRLNLAAHQWHMDHFGSDRFADIRWRFVDMVGRLIVHLEPMPWERQLLDRPIGVANDASMAAAAMEAAAPELLTTREAADVLRLSHRTMENWRQRNQGPPWVELPGRAIRYRRRDLDDWAAGRAAEVADDAVAGKDPLDFFGDWAVDFPRDDDDPGPVGPPGG